MANRKQAPLEIVEQYTALLTRAADERDQAAQELAQADSGLRCAIKEAFDAGITAGPIKRATRLSESRLYQVRDGRRR